MKRLKAAPIPGARKLEPLKTLVPGRLVDDAVVTKPEKTGAEKSAPEKDKKP